jgi:hypothetical protein
MPIFGFINYFFGLVIDRLALTKGQKELSSWFMLAAGLVGGVGRMTLLLLSALDEFGIIASLGEVVLMVLAVAVFLRGQLARGGRIQT